MSMFIVSNNTINDVSNLIVKLYPYMDLNDVFKRILNLNIEIWNRKYNENVKIDDLNYNVVDYRNYIYKDKYNEIRFKSEYFNTQITQLVESLLCYDYQIESDYINTLECKFTYSLIRELLENPLIKEIKYLISFNDLVTFDDENKLICGVKYDR